MMARRRTGGGLPVPCGAHAQPDGGPGRNLHIVFENLSAPAESAPRLDAGSPPLKSFNLFQSMFDVFAMVFIALFIGVTAASISVAIFILLFVRTG